MFSKFRLKKLDSKSQITSQEDVKDHRAAIVEFSGSPDAILHCCYTLTPDQFASLVKRTRVDTLVWYKAVWLIQHDAKMSVSDLMQQTGTTWPTAKVMMDKIKELLPAVQYLEKIERKEK